jgi:hypothetical protein
LRFPLGVLLAAELLSSIVSYGIKPAEGASLDQPESETPPVPPTKDPKKAAGSINPKEKNAFYDAFVQKADKRKKR